MFSVIITEFLKLNRSKILWLIPIGAITPVLMALGALSNIYNDYEPMAHSWGWLFSTVLVFTNYFFSAVFAILTGFIFTREYQENTANVLYTYPTSRLKFYFSKLIVLVPLAAATIIFSIVLTMISGVVFGYVIFIQDSMMIFIKYALLSVLINFLLAPIAALVGIIGKSILPSAVLGIAYVMSIMLLGNPQYNVYIPSCIPPLFASLKGSKLGGYTTWNGDLNTGYITLLVAFGISVLIGSIYYKNADIT